MGKTTKRSRKGLCLSVVFTVVVGSALLITPGEAANPKGGASPKAAATALYRAWRTNSRTAAGKIANAATVKKLFRTRASGPGWKFQACMENVEEEPRFDCSYTYPGGSATLGVYDSDAYGWFVNSITFRAD
jgi:hypothetical protein